MHRRFLFTAALGLALGPVTQALAQASDSDEAPAGAPHHSVSLQQMLVLLDQRFPLHYPVPGLLNLDVLSPRLRLLPEQNRLGAEMDVEASGPALPSGQTGTLGLDFALRYEASDRSIRAQRIRLQRLAFPTLQPALLALLRGYGQALAEQSLLEVVLHRLQAKDLALPDAMGLQPGRITVTAQGLDIGFVPKTPAAPSAGENKTLSPS